MGLATKRGGTAVPLIGQREVTTLEPDTLCGMSMVDAQELIERGDVSARDVTDAVLERIRRLEPALHAFITVDEDGVRRAADEADQAIRRGDPGGPLRGIPISVKDHFATRGLRTTVASSLYADNVPDRDAAVVERARGAGALIAGKANMYELGTGWGVFGHFPVALNPWDPTSSTGGSSSGSAVAVVSGLGYASLASDGGGSVRVPANYCGVVGIKPTHGRVSMFGSVPSMPPSLRGPGAPAKSISVAGVIARRVRDAAIVLRAIAGHDPRDLGTDDVPVPDYVAALTGDARGVRVGVPRAFIEEQVSAENLAAFESGLGVLRDAGAEISNVDPPAALADIGWMWTTIAYVEMAAMYGDDLAHRPDEFSPELLDRLHAGLATPREEYLRATQARATLREQTLAVLRECDVLVTPTAPAAPPSMDELRARRSDLQDIGQLARFTRPFNMTGLPAITVPDGFTASGLPLGLQVGGRPFEEGLIMRVADAYERRTPWHERRPLLI